MGQGTWTYDGDRDVRYGGHFWMRNGDDTTVEIVRVIPLSDEGGPDNMFRIQNGFLDLDSDDLEAARECADVTPGDMGSDVSALLHYSGLGNVDADYTVRIGAEDRLWGGRGPHPEPDYVLNGRTKLENWIRKEYLHVPEETAAAPSP